MSSVAPPAAEIVIRLFTLSGTIDTFDPATRSLLPASFVTPSTLLTMSGATMTALIPMFVMINVPLNWDDVKEALEEIGEALTTKAEETLDETLLEELEEEPEMPTDEKAVDLILSLLDRMYPAPNHD